MNAKEKSQSKRARRSGSLLDPFAKVRILKPSWHVTRYASVKTAQIDRAIKRVCTDER